MIQFFWHYYYPENDTTTGEPTGEYPMGGYAYVTHTYEDYINCVSHWEYWGMSIWDTIPNEGVYIRENACGEEIDDLLPGFGWGVVPVYIWQGKFIFTPISFFPGKWYVELYKRMAGGNKVFLKRDSFELKDTFTLGEFVFPSDTDTVYGVENIRILLHENHWAKVNLHITSIPVEKREIDTTVEFHIYRMEEEGVKSIPFDFGNTYGQVYMLTLDIEDFFGNKDKDTAFAIVGRPKIEVILNPDKVWPLYTRRIPRDSSRTEVIVKVTTPSGEPVQDYPVTLWAVREEYSGGHDHPNKPDGGPVGEFDKPEGKTDENGEFRTYYTASEFGGVEIIMALGQAGVMSEKELTVRVPMLSLLPEDTNYYKKVGGTPYHHCEPPQEDHNHWGTTYLISAIEAITFMYVVDVGEIIRITEMSLPYGGEFDVCGTWDYHDPCEYAPNGGHSTHRLGENADITGATPGSRFQNEEKMRNIIDLVEIMYRLNIDYPWEGNHYHFIVKPGR